MNLYNVDYNDSNGEMFHVQCEAKSEDAAEVFVKHFYWNVDTVIQVYKNKF